MSGASRRRKEQNRRASAPQVHAAEPLAAEPSSSYAWLGWCVVLAVAAFLWPVVLNGGSQVDDALTVLQNPRLNPPTFNANGVLWYWTQRDGLGLYTPLTYLAWGMLAKATYVPTADDAGQHLDPRIFHAASLLVHLINVALVYALLRWLLARFSGSRAAAHWPAAAGAMFYGLHPVQVESVAWLSGLKDPMYATASLASVLLYLRAVDPADGLRSPGQRRAAYMIGLLLVPIGMLCKPTAMVAPLIAAAIDGLLLRRPWRRVAVSIAPYLLAAVPLAIVARLVQPWGGVPTPPVWQRPIVSGASIAFYVGKLLVPLGLGFDYGWRPLVMLAKPWFWALGAAGIAGTAALIGLTARRAPWVAAAVSVFVCGLLPVLGLTPFSFQWFSTVADHYLVLSMLGPAMLIARAASRLPARVWVPLCGAWLIALGVLSIVQLRTWRDAETMARRMIAITPGSALGHNALGEILRNRGDRPAAEREFRTSADLNADFLGAPINLAELYASEGRPDDAIEAFHLMRKTADRLPPGIRPNYRHFLLAVLGRTAYDLNRREDLRKYYAEEVRLYGKD